MLSKIINNEWFHFRHYLIAVVYAGISRLGLAAPQFLTQFGAISLITAWKQFQAIDSKLSTISQEPSNIGKRIMVATSIVVTLVIQLPNL